MLHQYNPPFQSQSDLTQCDFNNFIISYCIAWYCIVGFGAQAVSRKTPLYFLSLYHIIQRRKNDSVAMVKTRITKKYSNCSPGPPPFLTIAMDCHHNILDRSLYHLVLLPLSFFPCPHTWLGYICISLSPILGVGNGSGSPLLCQRAQRHRWEDGHHHRYVAISILYCKGQPASLPPHICSRASLTVII